MADQHKPTAKQLRYLRALCETTGQTTSWPKTKHEASQAIARLKREPASTSQERYEDRRAVRDALADGGARR